MRRTLKAGLLPLLLVLSVTLGARGGVLEKVTGAWIPAANLLEARANSTATVLQDGRVLIAGGDGANGALATAEFFGADGSVSVAPAMTTARSRHFAVALQDGRVLVGGGVSSNGMPLFSAEIFDPVLNTWSPAASGMTEARAGAAAGLLPDGRVVVSGGDSGTLPSMTIELFDPATGTFALAGAMSAPRTKHAMAVLRDGRVMMMGGWSGSAVLQTTDIFDPGTGQLSVGPQLLAARMNHTATTSLAGPVVIAGGTDGQNDLASVEIFDPASGTMAAGTSLATARQGQLAVLLPNNNNILYVGGTAAGAPVAAAEMYSPWQATMVAAGANAVARSHAAASGTGADGVLLVSGGADANNAPLSGNELYGFATVKTDASDYAPGTTVTITGTGWKPGETVTLTLVESPLVDTHPVLTEVADANGNFVNTDFSPDTHDLNIRFFLTAVGTTSGLQVMNTFTDGVATSVSGTVTSSTTSAPIVGVTVSCSAGCNGTTPQITGSNGVYTFANNDKISFPGNGPATVTLTFTVKGFTTNSRLVTIPTNNATVTGQDIALNPISAGNSTVIANPTSVPANGTSFSSITVTLVDSANNPVSNKTIALLPNSGSSIISPSNTATNANGQAAFTVKDSNAETVTYSAKDASDAIVLTQTAPVTFTPLSVSTSATVISSLNPMTYGNSVTITANIAPASGSVAPTGTVQFRIDGVNSGAPVPVSACAPAPDACATMLASTLTAGNHSIEADFTGTGGVFNSSVGALVGGQTVNKKSLTVTGITAASKTYDATTTATLSTSGAALSGMVNSDPIVLNTASAVGSFADKNIGSSKSVNISGLTISGTNSTSYTLAQPTATADISAKSLTIGGLTANNKMYDSTTAASLSGTANLQAAQTPGTGTSADGKPYSGDSLSVSGSANGTFASSNVGVGIAVTVSGLSLTGGAAGNYSLTMPNLTADISAANLTYVADAKTRSYGASDPAFTGTVTGFVGTESQATATTGTLAFATTAVATSGVGNYPINGSGLSANNGNYNFAQAASNATALTITKAHLTVTADNQQKTYDGKVFSPFTASITGFVNGENASVVSGGAAFTGQATTATNAGSYAITPTLGALSATNYDFTNFVNGTLIISQAHLTVTADNQAKTYDGAPFVSFTATITGFVNGENSSVLTGAPEFGGPAVAAINAGAFAIAPYQGTLSANNYDFPAANFVPGTLTINQAPSMTTVSVLGGASFTFDASAHPATVSVTGAGGLSKSPSPAYSCGHAPVNVADNGCTASYAYAGDANHLPSSGSITYTISAASLTITPDGGKVKILGAVFTAFTGTVSGLKGTDAVTVSYTSAGAPTAAAIGSYDITVANYVFTSGAAANYAITTNTAVKGLAVQYGFAGLFAPYATPAQGSSKINSANPLKWQYTDVNGNAVASSSANPSVVITGPYACGGADSGSPITANAAGNSGYQYELGSNTWQFNWKTTGLSAGCYNITIKSNQSGQSNGVFPIQLK